MKNIFALSSTPTLRAGEPLCRARECALSKSQASRIENLPKRHRSPGRARGGPGYLISKRRLVHNREPQNVLQQVVKKKIWHGEHD
jgi:hypothetical protein